MLKNISIFLFLIIGYSLAGQTDSLQTKGNFVSLNSSYSIINMGSFNKHFLFNGISYGKRNNKIEYFGSIGAVTNNANFYYGSKQLTSPYIGWEISKYFGKNTWLIQPSVLLNFNYSFRYYEGDIVPYTPDGTTYMNKSLNNLFATSFGIKASFNFMKKLQPFIDVRTSMFNFYSYHSYSSTFWGLTLPDRSKYTGHSFYTLLSGTIGLKWRF